MIRKLDGVLLSTSNSKKLADFYKDVVGIKCTAEWEMGEKAEVGYEFASVSLYINPHSGIKGKAKDPSRFMLNLEVDDIEKEVKRLKKAKVKVKQDIYHMEGYGLIATLIDVDGNYFQLVQVRPIKK